jgi:hypothetical protein
MYTRVCTICGTIFQAKRATRKTCSEKCRLKRNVNNELKNRSPLDVTYDPNMIISNDTNPFEPYDALEEKDLLFKQEYPTVKNCKYCKKEYRVPSGIENMCIPCLCKLGPPKKESFLGIEYERNQDHGRSA